ncbi:MAG: substrate-binding domain-containing protein, partial [Rubrivivax sp.]
MSDTVTAISSMATREVLAELSQALARTGGPVLQIESVGGVDAARRVQGGEAFDLVFLAADALERLEAAGAVVAGSRVDLLRSPVAVAVAAGAAKPDISSAAALCEAVRSARCIGYSTGPSGTFLMQLFEHWGLKAA